MGYKILRSPEPYTFKPVTRIDKGTHQHFEVKDLNRYTEYSIVVQAYNSRGAGPPSEEAIARTLEFGKNYVFNYSDVFFFKTEQIFLFLFIIFY